MKPIAAGHRFRAADGDGISLRATIPPPSSTLRPVAQRVAPSTGRAPGIAFLAGSATTAALLFAGLLLASAAAAAGAENPVAGALEEPPPDSPVLKTESFEGELPSYVGVEKGRIGISGQRSQDGVQSLRWDWVAGDTLTFKTGPLGKISGGTGYGGYSHPAFSMNIFTETPSDGVVIFKWMSGDKVGARFELPLIFKGWQRICYHYSLDSKLNDRNDSILEKTDRIVVEAPKGGIRGTAYFDTINFNKPFDFRDGREPIAKLWQPFDIAKDCQDPAILAPPTPKELKAVAQFLATTPGRRTWTEKDMKEGVAIEQKFRDKYSLERLPNDRVIGKVIPNFSISVGADLGWLADRWRETSPATDPKIRERIENAYFLLDDFFRESGAVAQGSLGDLRWYGGRAHCGACLTMQEPLRRTGRLASIRNCLKFHNKYDVIFQPAEGRTPKDMDYFHTDVDYLLKIALMHDTAPEIVSHLRAVARQIGIAITDTIEADGSIFHHNFYNFSYVGYGFPSLARQINYLSSTPFAVPRAAFEKAKLAALEMRWFCNLSDAPLSMHGRHPGRTCLAPVQYLSLAEAGRLYNDGKLDRELAAAYLRFLPAKAAEPGFAAEGVAPEPAPQGNHSLNYATLMGHRRGEWLAVARGYSKYLPSHESYANANRHGLFIGNGALDILATGNPINIIDSGCDIANGWDWRNLDGTTSYFAPYAKIANGNGSLSERSDAGFVGGLSHRGSNGVFVMPLHSQIQYAKSLPEGRQADPKKSFAANKSYFFFDDRIVCLGSGVALPDSPYSVRTTLFQKHLKTPDMPIGVDAKFVTQLPWRAELAQTAAHTLLDIQETGYYLPSGQNVTVTREHQKSRDGHDEKETQGDAATAWIEHGVNPSAAGYVYVVLPRTTPEKLRIFTAAMGARDGEEPLVIWQKDDRAHIVFDRASRTWGCVFFTAQDVVTAARVSNAAGAGKQVPQLPVIAVSRPCLAMGGEDADGRIAMTVCDPDLRLEKRESQSATVAITLRGRWRLLSADSAITISPDGIGNSVLSVACIEGRSYSLAVGR